MEESDGRSLGPGRGRCSRRRWVLGSTLVALGEETEGVDLLDEVAHACPPTEPKPQDQYPHHHKRVHHVDRCPARKEEWWFFRCVLIKAYKERRCKIRGSSKRKIHIYNKRIEAYLSGSSALVGQHVRRGGNDVDGEADQKCTDGGVDGTEEGEDDGQEPDGYDHRQPRYSSQAYALGAVHPDHLLPNEVQGSTCKAEGDELPMHMQQYKCSPALRKGTEKGKNRGNEWYELGE